MSVEQLNHYIPILSTVLEIAVCLAAAHRRLWTRLPYFFIYLTLVVFLDLGRWVVLVNMGYSSAAYQWTYWMTQIVMLLSRGAALADICHAALGYYTGVWRMARTLLAGAAAAMLIAAVVHTWGQVNIASYLVFVERELEFAVVITLFVLLLLSRYYDVQLERPLGGAALGLAFYSTVIIVCNSILMQELGMTWPDVTLVRTLAFVGALAIWAPPLMAPLPEAAPPILGTEEGYERNARIVSDRMRALNERLEELMKR